MDRIAQSFAAAKEKGRVCFIAYVCAGDPNYEISLEVCRTLVENGVDLLELGVPFSDPLADGLTNQRAAQRALESGMTGEKVFALVKEMRSFTDKPIVFYTYYNLVFSPGIENYVRQVKEAGVDGLLTLDLPPEEAHDLVVVSREYDVKNIFIVAPTTPPHRIEIIAKATSGFIYYVSREGVTGERETLEGHIGEAVRKIKKQTDLPVVVGFGISTPEQVGEVAAVADGVVVGSALVNCIAAYPQQPEQLLRHLSEKLACLTALV